MIKSFQISNYRSCLNTSIELQPDLSVLIGPNGAGKTNILKAILLMRKLGEARRRLLDNDYSEFDNEISLKCTFVCDNKKSIFSSKMSVHNDENNNDVVSDSDQSWYAKDYTGNGRRLKLPLFFSDAHFVYHLDGNMRLRSRRAANAQRDFWFEPPSTFESCYSRISKFVSEIKYYSASQFTNPSLCPASIEIENDRSRRRPLGIRGVHGRFLYDLYQSRDSETYQEFFSIIGPDGIGLIDNLEFEEIKISSVEHNVLSAGKIRKSKTEKQLVVPKFFIGDNILSASQLSEGTFKTITLLFYLITEKSSALFIEEPEVCVHQGLLESIVELIVSYSIQKQIIVSTHSDFVLDKIQPRQVYQVRKTHEEGTKVRQITKTMTTNELKALKQYLREEGNLGEYWRHGGLE